MLNSPAADVFAFFESGSGLKISRLECLTYSASLDQRDHDIDVAGVMESLLSSLQFCPLQHLKILMQHSTSRPPAELERRKLDRTSRRPSSPTAAWVGRMSAQFRRTLDAGL
ncbi:hypothetical protein BV20DRAFT_861686 [Pilatotrama ljubarskyi]|nr:hypothetical protein BV20DRAFT_861686 [Pilatotrama ljubarskyi]